eukprot:6392464-Pyramimonas_sp.AAC.1
MLFLFPAVHPSSDSSADNRYHLITPSSFYTSVFSYLPPSYKPPPLHQQLPPCPWRLRRPPPKARWLDNKLAKAALGRALLCNPLPLHQVANGSYNLSVLDVVFM